LLPIHTCSNHDFTAYRYDPIDDDRANDGTVTHEIIFLHPYSATSNATGSCYPISLLTLTFTTCKIYLPPTVPISKDNLMNCLFVTTPSPYSRDFNAKHFPSGSDHIDNRVTVVADVSARFNSMLLNKGVNTHFCLGFRTTSALDLAFRSRRLCAL